MEKRGHPPHEDTCHICPGDGGLHSGAGNCWLNKYHYNNRRLQPGPPGRSKGLVDCPATPTAAPPPRPAPCYGQKLGRGRRGPFRKRKPLNKEQKATGSPASEMGQPAPSSSQIACHAPLWASPARFAPSNPPRTLRQPACGSPASSLARLTRWPRRNLRDVSKMQIRGRPLSRLPSPADAIPFTAPLASDSGSSSEPVMANWVPDGLTSRGLRLNQSHMALCHLAAPQPSQSPRFSCLPGVSSSWTARPSELI